MGLKKNHRRSNWAALVVCLLVLAGVTPAPAETHDPAADPQAVVVSGQARFTVLTPQLIRMEWAAPNLRGQFEDRASLVFIHRQLPVPAFRTRTERGWLMLETDKLTLRYQQGSGRFTAENLSVEFTLNGKKVSWRPGMADTGNLRGTIRTLDGVKGATDLEPGMVSRDGWVVVDDTERPLFDGSEWPWAVARSAGERQDWYFFGYGHDYQQALRDFTRVAGKIPLPPRFAFGTWWSRYWAYTDLEFKELVEEFETHDVPLDVLVIDMDWHPTFNSAYRKGLSDAAGQRLGWTGYTWNKTLFPDPEGFLAWAEQKGLKTPLNLHPAAGTQPHEERYAEMARAMGIDPATQQYVPFDIADKKFAENYLEILHHPLERQGVDFWWLDWQQHPTTSIPGLNPTWWLNYVHFTDRERQGKRPLIFHRWGGLGNHRYQIGFSGDTISVWESLAFQPYFTTTASNVGFGYWSHDIGGHMPGQVSPELYTRWIQYGVFSPILRTHTTKNPEAERRLWAYPFEYAKVMREAFLLRYALIPYIYTASRQAYDTGLSLCRPLYYDHPEREEAYTFTDEYLFGDDLLVAPIAAPLDAQSQLVRKKLWLPDGEWVEWFTGARISGPAEVERSFALDEIPVYVRAGAVIPLQPKMRHTGEQPVDPLILAVFPGTSGETHVYEDEGDTLGYKNDAYAWTTVRHTKLANSTRKIEILPTEGRYPGMPTERSYEIRLVGSWPPEAVRVNGEALEFSREHAAPGWWYEGKTLTTVIALPQTSRSEHLEVQVTVPAAWQAENNLLDGVPGRLSRLWRVMLLLNQTWRAGWSPDSLIEAVETGNRIGLWPETAREELEKLQRSWPQILRDIEALEADGVARETLDRARAHLAEVADP